MRGRAPTGAAGARDEVRGPRPRRLVWVGASLVAASIVVAAGARVTGFGAAPTRVGTEAARVTLHFEDLADGSVGVHSAETGRPVGTVEPGSGGFVRGVLRGMARERRARALDAEPPFELVLWTDGRLSLEDPSTGREIELSAFGPTNAQAFASFLPAQETSR